MFPLGVLKRKAQSAQSWIDCPFNIANGLNDLSDIIDYSHKEMAD